MMNFFGVQSIASRLEVGQQEETWIRERAHQLERYCASIFKYYRSEDLTFWNHPFVLNFFNLNPINKISEFPLRSSSNFDRLPPRPSGSSDVEGISKVHAKNALQAQASFPAPIDPQAPVEKESIDLMAKETLKVQEVVVQSIGCQVKGQKDMALQIYDEIQQQNLLIESISGRIKDVSTLIEKSEAKIKKHIL